MELEHVLTLHIQINLKGVKDPNVRSEIIKLSEKSTGRTLYDINHIKMLYDPTLRVMEIKTKINKWKLRKCKSFCTAKVKVKSLSHVRLFATPWTVAQQAPPSMGFSRQEYWSGLPFPSPGDLPNSGIKPGSPALQADAREPPGKPHKETIIK